MTALSGCANLGTYNKVRTVDATLAQQTYVEAKQRVVLTVPGTTRLNDMDSAVVRTCAEPSPDALSAIALGGNAGLSAAQKASVQAAFALSETASSIGLRTQSIQLMRDAMYRLCEGVASGALTSMQFETLHRRFQNSMVAILAIEQLTGTVRAGAAQLSATAGVGSAKEIAALAKDTAEAWQAATDADAAAVTKRTARDKARAAADAFLQDKGGSVDALTDTQQKDYAKLTQALTDATSAAASADATAANAKDKYALLNRGMQAIGGGNIATSGTASVTGGSPVASPGATEAVATAVAGIVSDQLNLGFFREACATLFVAQIEGRVVAATAADVAETCKSYAEQTVAMLTTYNAVQAAYARNIEMLTDRRQALIPSGAGGRPPVNAPIIIPPPPAMIGNPYLVGWRDGTPPPAVPR